MTGYRTFIVMFLGLIAAWLQSRGILFPESDQAAIATAIVSVAGIVMRLLTKSPPGTPPSNVAPVLILGLLGLGLTACTPDKALHVAQVACRIDAVAQPVLVSTAPLTGSATLVTAASIDAALVHPAVVAACQAVDARATPVGVVLAPTSGG